MKQTAPSFKFSFKNVANETVDIFIDGYITDPQTQAIYKEFWGDDSFVSYKSFRNALNDIQANTYNIYLNCGGGDVIQAQAMHDFIIDLQVKGKTVNTIGRGIIASAATFILMASKNPVMSDNSWFMIHNVSGGIFGDVNEVESYAATMRQFNNQARDFYANATGMRKEDITKMMDAETWMTAEEAKAKGFIKQITGKASFSNSIKPEHWQFSNTAVLNAYNAAAGQLPAPNDIKTFIQNQNDQMKKFFTDIVNAIKGVKPAEGADQAALVQQIATAVTVPFEAVGDEIETTITNQVNAGLKSKDVTDAITAAATAAVGTAVTNATNAFTQRIVALETSNTDLVKKNGELEQEITNLKGKATGGKEDTSNAPKVIGSFG